MRRVLAELVLATFVNSLAAASDTQIDAPMPPYCNPRGNWAECAPDSGTTEFLEFSADEIDDLVEFHPFVREKSDRALGVAGGYAKLTLRWVEDENEPSAILAVVSRRALTSRTAAQLAIRYQKILDEEGVLSVGIERFAWPWQRDSQSDWCELSRDARNQAWVVECGDE